MVYNFRTNYNETQGGPKKLAHFCTPYITSRNTDQF